MASSDSKLTKVDPRSIGSPKGTRDFYPEDLLRRRYITEVWRAVSIRHGFEEIDGPTFEHSELYAVKSGEGILGELFQAFSGKAEDEREQVRETGNAPFALRPEFTPTLARMYAARAKQLPKPVRWFCVPNFFRAEKPQRGRLREFMQWNVDVIGGEEHEAVAHDLEVMGLLVSCMSQLGLASRHAQLHFNNREVLGEMLEQCGATDRSTHAQIFNLLDRREKISDQEYGFGLAELGLDIGKLILEARSLQKMASSGVDGATVRQMSKSPINLPAFFDALRRGEFDEFRDEEGKIDLGHPDLSRIISEQYIDRSDRKIESTKSYDLGFYNELYAGATQRDAQDWYTPDLFIVRGLAYYTGTVFELIAEGERAVAGGGRYDNLIELFGGPPTPACGFGMGDVVLGNLLDDQGLMPADGAEIMDAIQRTVSGVSLRPEVFVVSGGEEHDHLVQPLLANLRAGIEADGFDGKPWDGARFDGNGGGVRPMHARTTAKATRNLKKLLSDAERQYARFVAVIHGEEKVQLKDLDAREDLGDFAIDPSAREDADLPQRRGYVGRAILERLGQSH